MLDRRWRKVVRDAWLYKARSFLVVLAIAVGLAGAGTILIAWSLVRRATHDEFLASNPAAATIRTDSIDTAVLAAARAVSGVADVQARRVVSGVVQAEGTWRPALFFAMDSVATARIGVVRREAGTWPPPDGEVVLEQSSVGFSGITVGESLNIDLGDGEPKPLRVVGLARDVGVAPGWMEHLVYAFVTPRTLAMLGVPSSLNELQITVTDRSLDQDAVRRIAYQVKAAVERTGRRVHDVDVPIPGEHVHAAQMDSLLYTQAAFGVLALIVCGLLVANLMAAMLAGQIREIGVMKTLGADTSQLTRMYVVFAMALGVVATAVALPIAIVAGRRYALLKGEMLNFDITRHSIPWWAVALLAIVGALLPALAAMIPVRRGCRASVASALRDIGISENAEWSVRFVHRVPGVSRPTLLSLRNAFRKRQRLTLTLLALASGGAVFLAARNLRTSVIGGVDLLYAPQRYEFSIRLDAPHAIDSIEATIADVGGVRAVEAWTGSRATVARADGTSGNSFGITAPPSDSKLFVPTMVAGRWVATSDTAAIVVSRALLERQPELQLGRVVAFELGDRSAHWTVVGIADGGPIPTAYTSREVLLRATGARGVSTAMVASAATGVASQVELIQRVRRALDERDMRVASSQLLAESRRVLEDHLLMVVEFLGAMGWVMIVVGGMGLASTMGLAVLERRREIGVMRAIGARNGAIIRMIQAEGFVIALLSWIVALPISLPISAALANAFGRVMLEVPVTWIPELASVSIWLGLVIGVSAVACAWPSVRATRVTVASALSYE